MYVHVCPYIFLFAFGDRMIKYDLQHLSPFIKLNKIAIKLQNKIVQKLKTHENV